MTMLATTDKYPASMPASGTTAVVIPIGSGKEAALDTMDSVSHYCPEPHIVVIIDDCTTDGTYEALVDRKRPNWHILRNPYPMGIHRLVHSLASAYRFVLQQDTCQLVLRLDQDALLIKRGVIGDLHIRISKSACLASMTAIITGLVHMMCIAG